MSILIIIQRSNQYGKVELIFDIKTFYSWRCIVLFLFSAWIFKKSNNLLSQMGPDGTPYSPEKPAKTSSPVGNVPWNLIYIGELNWTVNHTEKTLKFRGWIIIPNGIFLSVNNRIWNPTNWRDTLPIPNGS